MAPLLIQLRSNRDKYRTILGDIMAEKAGNNVGLQELQAIMSVTGLQDASYIAEQPSGKSCLLALCPIDVQNVEEAVLQVQGFIIEASLPPMRQVDIPLTLTELGTDGFDLAVRGVQTIHQVLSNHVSRAGGHLRNWTPGCDGQDLTLMFGNRYLTSSRDVGGDVSIDMSPIVDPLNVLRPLIKTEVHTADNVVEYWEHRGGHTTRYDYNLSVIHVLVSGQLSLLKKIKCKVGYRMSSSDESGNDDGQSVPNKHLRRLILSEAEGEVERTDVSMKEIA
ncbi:hypothetical protein V8D89_016311 [Ganoderma adspersum]